MTDKEFIDFLNGRTNKNHTTIMVVFSEKGTAKNVVITLKDIVDFINRQQAEIEDARNGILSFKNKYESAINTSKDLQSVIKEKDAEIERLTNNKCEDCAGCTQWLCDCSNERAQAIKEYTEKLIFEIVNRPYSKDSADVFYMNGRVDRQNEIIDIIKELSSECSKSVSSCQQNTPCNLGDTVYCVNGYGSQRYIEEFTVAEIRITKDGIWLTDTKGMEWLARVCHLSRESAEKELRASAVTKPDYCSFFYNRFMKTE